jgi:HD-like signal output (HDOD) protein
MRAHCWARCAHQDGEISQTSGRYMSMTRAELRKLHHRLPVFPAQAALVIRLCARAEVDSDKLISLGKSDPMLAGELIGAANAAHYLWSGTVKSVERAVFYLGTDLASAVLLRTAIRPMYALQGHTALLDHSLAVARLSSDLVAKSGVPTISTAESYLLGLLHDVGQLLFRALPQEHAGQIDRMLEAGIDRLTAEDAV